ncbi:MAG: ABC transporter permease [Acidobacteria bacterium]|nr:ABC transporter permease [Acidobacteriota bacterium]
MSTLMQDLRYALRSMVGAPGFTALAVVTLALGIGASTAIFSVANAVLWKPLPYPRADAVVAIGEASPDGESNVGFATFKDLERESRTLASVTVASEWQPSLTGVGEPERLEAQRVTSGYFRTLGVHPALGRDFMAADDVRGSHYSVILSHGLWKRRFGGDASLIGKTIALNEHPYTLVGVMPEDFQNFIKPAVEAWAPLGYNESLPWACRTCRHLRAFGRLREGVTLAEADQELNHISADIVRAHPQDYAAPGVIVTPLGERLTRSIRPALFALLGGVGFVVLIACANVASLLLGRAVRRESEFAVRAALGAGRWRVVRQLLTETALLSLAGGGAGIALAAWGIRALRALSPAGLLRAGDIRIDGPVLAFALGLSLITGLLAGLAPAIVTARRDLQGALRQGPRSSSPRSHALRGALVVAEIALALILLVGAGLLLRSVDRLLAVDPGFDPKGILSMEVSTSGARYEKDEPTLAFFARAGEAVGRLPGVESAAWVSQLPLGGNFDRYGIQIEEKPLANPELGPSADRYAASAGYLKTMGIPVLRGRGITDDDRAGAPPVILINDTFSRRTWPGEDPIGKRVRLGDPNGPWRTIVGIVGDVKHTGLDADPTNQIYLPQPQWGDSSMVLVVRTRAAAADLTASVRQAVWSVDKDQPIAAIATMDQLYDTATARRRFALELFEVFAAVALALAAAGIYGALAASVSERTREIGIRSALGATRGHILALVMRRGAVLTFAGLALGAAGALAVARLLAGLLFATSVNDPLTFATVAAILAAVGLAAAFVPAWRAARVDPVIALRSE